MNWKTWTLLLAALLAGGAASYGVKSLFFVERAEVEIDDASQSGAKERMLVANGALPAGTELCAQNVRLVLELEKNVPRDAVASFSDAVGRATLRDLKDGEPISVYDLESEEEQSDVGAAFVPPGCSVVPIEIATACKEGGSRNYLKSARLDKIVRPGDIVDVFVVREDDRNGSPGARRLVSEPIMTDVSVFSVVDENRFTSEGVARRSILSALMTVEQIAALRRANELGKLKIVFKNGDSDAVSPLDPNVSEGDLSSRGGLQPFRISTSPEPEPVLSRDLDANPNASFVLDVPQDDVDVDVDAPSAKNVDESSSVGKSLDAPNSFDAQAREPDASDVDLGAYASPYDDDLTLENVEPSAAVATDEADEADEDDEQARKASAPRWNRVDFNREVEERGEENAIARDDAEPFWIGDATFRARDAASPAPSSAVSAESSVFDANGDAVDKRVVGKNYKKTSPFPTVPSRRKTP